MVEAESSRSPREKMKKTEAGLRETDAERAASRVRSAVESKPPAPQLRAGLRAETMNQAGKQPKVHTMSTWAEEEGTGLQRRETWRIPGWRRTWTIDSK